MGEATWLGPVELDLETLRRLVTVSAEGSLARAAPLLFVSTSGLSRRIHELEGQLGVELLERSTHGVILTPPGSRSSCTPKRSSRRAMSCTPRPARSQSARARAGCSIWGSVTGRELDARPGRCGGHGGGRRCRRRRRPGREHAPDQEADVGELDVAILHQQPISPEVRSFQLGSKRTQVALARHLPQASLGTLSLSDLTSLPFVTSSALNAGTPVFYAPLRSIFEEAGINRVVDVGAFDFYALRQHIVGGSGFGIAIGSDESSWDNAVIRTVADLELRLGTWVARSRKTEDDAALLRALGRLRDEYGGSSNNGTASGGGLRP